MTYSQVEPKAQELVVLVDSQDNQVGTMDKFEAHKGEGTLHRAISVLLFDENGRWLLQKRAANKPLWPMYWSNTVCTHPRVRESYLDCARRRLKEELGISVPIKLEIVDRIEYQAAYDNHLSEYELDTVIVGTYQGQVVPSPLEVSDYRWVSKDELQVEIESNPEDFTPWFKLIFQSFNSKLG